MTKFLVPGFLIAALALPLAHAYGPGNGPGQGSSKGPGFDRPPMEQVRPDYPRPMMGHHHTHGPKHGWDRGTMVRTFGMDEARAKLFMDRLADYLHLQPSQHKAWEGMQKMYLLMVKDHGRWRADRPKESKPMPPQQRLEARADRMEKHARHLKEFAKNRAALEKVLTPQQMRDFDWAMSTGKANLLPPPMPKK